MQKLFQLMIALHLCLLAAATQSPAFAAEPLVPELLRNDSSELRPNQQRLVAVDRELILELIKLARFNIRFHEEANRRWVWRSWLYPIAQEAGTGASFANTLIDLTQRARGLKNIGVISKPMQKRGLKSAIVGNSISGGASAAELAQNVMLGYMAGRQGFSPRKSVAFVKGQLATIDKLLEQRRQVVAASRPGPIQQIHELEARLLHLSRDQLLLEFERWSAHSRETMWRQNTFYAIDSLQNFTSVSSSLISRRAFSIQSLKGTAAILALVANSAAALDPPIRTSVGFCMRKYQRWHMAKVFPDQRPESTKAVLAEWVDLQQQASMAGPGTGDRLHIEEAAFFAANTEKNEAVLSREQDRIDKLRQVAIQQSISGPIIAMASVARSLLATVAYYDYRAEPVIANKLSFAGRISQTFGQSYSLINTPTTRINQTIYTARLKKRGELPAQILEKRLKRLDELEREILGASKLDPAAENQNLN